VKPIVSVFEACVALDTHEKWMADRPYLLMNNENVDSEHMNIEGLCVCVCFIEFYFILF
jgi:hypothetical protein